MALSKLMLIFIAGGIGTLLRFGIVNACLAFLSSSVSFPIGTLIANALGCFLAGIVFAIPTDSAFLHPSVRLVIITGLFGGLTTFSSLILEIYTMILGQSYEKAAFYLTISIAVGLSFAFLGERLVASIEYFQT